VLSGGWLNIFRIDTVSNFRVEVFFFFQKGEESCICFSCDTALCRTHRCDRFGDINCVLLHGRRSSMAMKIYVSTRLRGIINQRVQGSGFIC